MLTVLLYRLNTQFIHAFGFENEKQKQCGVHSNNGTKCRRTILWFNAHIYAEFYANAVKSIRFSFVVQNAHTVTMDRCNKTISFIFMIWLTESTAYLAKTQRTFRTRSALHTDSVLQNSITLKCYVYLRLLLY